LQPFSLAAVQYQSAAWQPKKTALQLQLYKLVVLQSQQKHSKLDLPAMDLLPSHQEEALASLQKRTFAAAARHVLVLHAQM